MIINFNSVRNSILVLVALCSINAKAQSLEEIATQKIKTLEAVIKKAEKKGIDVQKEKMTIRTAEVFLKFANWDENHIDENVKQFKVVPIYKDTALQAAKMLPDFERKEVVKILDNATNYLNKLVKGEVVRTSTPNIDWAKVSLKKDALMYKNKPVFLADYTWKPKIPELTEYHGNQDGFFLTPTFVEDSKGTVRKKTLDELNSKLNGTMGFIFFNHKNVPDWAEKQFGPNFKMREDTYTAYDIDNPGAKFIQESLIKATVPKMAGKKYTQLGYMLCNEPHFYTTEGTWASGPVSKYTIDKYKVWLKEKHQTIATLNDRWKTDFKSFEDLQISMPISEKLVGTAKWYDWVTFNNYRVTEWYKFMKSEILKYDSQAKVHLKIMPNLWSENRRNHGLDIEALTDLSGIIGNDSGSEYSKMWGKPEEILNEYAFNWRELSMANDFFKSVSPNKIMYNTELHYLSTNSFRDLNMPPAYARATFWMAHTSGLNASQTWFWARKEDGSARSNGEKGYAGSINHQPHIVNEVAATMIDLNTFSEEITAMQRQQKPIRIFYSETSATNKLKHMDDVFECYEDLYFEGVSIGFATENIIKKQDNNLWKVVLVYKTEFVTANELHALQNYLDNGGFVIIDKQSLKKNEYGMGLNPLKSSKNVIEVASLEEMKVKAFEVLNGKNALPEIEITEENAIGTKGCVWKVVKNNKGNYVLSIVNIGKTNATLNIKQKGTSKIVCKDLINGITVSSTPILKPFEVYFVEVIKK